jgi:hypothetical protein
MAAMSGEGENIQQDFQEDCRAGDHKANSWDFYYTVENECQEIVEGLAPSEMKEDIHNYAHQHLKLASDQKKARFDRLANCVGYNKGDKV